MGEGEARERIAARSGGATIGLVFSGLSACVMDGTTLEAVLYTTASAHAAYTIDHFVDGDLDAEADGPLLLSVAAASCLSTGILLSHGMLGLIPLQLCAAPAYVPFKKAFPLLKPAYVAAAWVVAGVAVPSAMAGEAPDPMATLSMASMLWAESNRMDVLDAAEDAEAGIETLPVRLGRGAAERAGDAAALVSVGSALLSARSYGHLALGCAGAAPLLRRAAVAVRSRLFPGRRPPRASAAARTVVRARP